MIRISYTIFSFDALFEGPKRTPSEWVISLMRKLQFHQHIVVASWHKERCRADMIGVLRDLAGRPSKVPLLILEPEEDNTDPRFWLLNSIRRCILHFKQNPELVIVENSFMDSRLGAGSIVSEIGMLLYKEELQQFNILQVFNKL